ncbi:TylF/MycF/NovP-related O-methyltransferase [Tenuifilum thalassicum]|uniref:Macrocin O-methyltransferase n=1 Tax=Tenuifilum thalassicum TaxID=2590900 RepID=A0A7D3XN12_9BACT|nr:TylF/MycF/NovP-related O-methyltransferase [Tenuifilum thalassicum]QKG80636.1 macrocin O-methyltransferase [Tenuifilum thalassicum]
MLHSVKRNIQKLANIFGYQIAKVSNVRDKDERFKRIYERCKKFTMTPEDRMYALYKAVEYIIKANIPGDFVECGVWRGGSAMLITYTLLDLNVVDRKIYLYDTFQGMPRPTENDYRVSDKNIRAFDKWKKNQKENYNSLCYASLSVVKKNMALTKYPSNNIVFVKGKVEETIPNTMPSKIAILRLDTDWYESTKHELIHLFPLLAKNGVLIVDDYGHWAGSKKAVDEYFSNKPILFNRIDYSGRIAIKIE